MIPEREREALMRLTMCAREECGMCKYKDTCDFDFQYEIATECMYILADALNADRKTEPQNGYQTFNGTSVYISRFEVEPQKDIPILTAEEWAKIKKTMPESRLILFDDDGIAFEPHAERSE